jgi:hypothetical protein
MPTWPKTPKYGPGQEDALITYGLEVVPEIIRTAPGDPRVRALAETIIGHLAMSTRKVEPALRAKAHQAQHAIREALGDADEDTAAN